MKFTSGKFHIEIYTRNLAYSFVLALKTKMSCKRVKLNKDDDIDDGETDVNRLYYESKMDRIPPRVPSAQDRPQKMTRSGVKFGKTSEDIEQRSINIELAVSKSDIEFLSKPDISEHVNWDVVFQRSVRLAKKDNIQTAVSNLKTVSEFWGCVEFLLPYTVTNEKLAKNTLGMLHKFVCMKRISDSHSFSSQMNVLLSLVARIYKFHDKQIAEHCVSQWKQGWRVKVRRRLFVLMERALIEMKLSGASAIWWYDGHFTVPSATEQICYSEYVVYDRMSLGWVSEVNFLLHLYQDITDGIISKTAYSRLLTHHARFFERYSKSSNNGGGWCISGAAPPMSIAVNALALHILPLISLSPLIAHQFGLIDHSNLGFNGCRVYFDNDSFWPTVRLSSNHAFDQDTDPRKVSLLHFGTLLSQATKRQVIEMKESFSDHIFGPMSDDIMEYMIGGRLQDQFGEPLLELCEDTKDLTSILQYCV